MHAGPSYRVVMIGSEADFASLDASLSAAPGRLHIALSRLDVENQVTQADIETLEPDVAIIGASVDRPLPVAYQLRTLRPQAQLVFLLPLDRLERLRAGLPFVPNLASSWSADAAGDAAVLADLLVEAGRISRERIATDTVLGRINQRLARKPAPEQVRRSQLVLSERYLATILTQSPDAFIAVDKAGTLIAHNDAAARLFGPVTDAELTNALELFPEDERARVQSLLGRAIRGETLSGIEVRLGAARNGLHAELSLAPVQNEAGAVASVSITARDITERKRAEDRQRLLINELNHRVKNTLAIVQALAQQSFRGLAPPEEERSAFNARLSALAAAHSLLTRQTWEQVDLAQVVETTVHAACGTDAHRHRNDGPQVMLPPQTAVSLAMVIHELCTNAIKHGALSTDAGTILTQWAVHQGEDGPRLHFDWTERGGPPVEPPTRRGFGTRLIKRGLATELAAQVDMDFQREGLVCSLDAPLPQGEG